MQLRNRLVVWMIFAVALVPLAAAQKYTIIDLGTFPGGKVSQGQAVNIAGQVAGFSRFANFNAHGAWWRAGKGWTDLGAIPPGTNFSAATAINNFAQLVGYSDYNNLLQQHAVLWSKGKHFDLGTLPGGRSSQANGINDFGEVVGFSDSANMAGTHAVIWSPNGGPHDLGTLTGGYYSQGTAINNSRVVTGFSNAADGAWHGFVWAGKQGMQALPNLPNAYSASGNAINVLGEIAGGSANLATLWQADINHTVVSLGTLPGAGWSTAFGINDLAQIVGWSGFTAFIWTSSTGMQDLNTLIPTNSGWQLSAAYSINNRGQITGEGIINGQQHGFLLTPVAH
jgi:probable HAF family extracellular repeat protein